MTSLIDEHAATLADGGGPVALGAGTRVGKYELIRELGRGGMGRVFLARDTHLGRRVAVKLLSAAGPALARRFLHEARTTARVSHENIVVIHEVDEHAAVPYMVLEYLEGHALGELVARGGLPWPRAVELVVPVVRALCHAHAHGVVHRDLKPDNVFVTAAGKVKVLDFGIAKAFAAPDTVEAAAQSPQELGDLRLTRQGAILGTLPYMAPEQCGMGEVDERTDVWAAGLLLFELIAGQHPLHPSSAPVLVRSAALLDEPLPSIAARVPHLPPALVGAIDRCLEKRQERRVASARELLALLEPLLPGSAGRALAQGQSPYPGLRAFHERDAARFFGRDRDVARTLERLRDHPLVVVVGPSGVGKSSFVRAGLLDALVESGERWETFSMRPGRDPLAALAALVERPADLLRDEPGLAGSALRERAGAGRALLFIDQLEELFTLAGRDDREAFAACLAGIADDAASPVRVVATLRSDFLDQAAEEPHLVTELLRGLVFLAPPDEEGLKQALVRPLELAGHRFESPWIVDDMVAGLRGAPGALPLLQFAAARLWDTRDAHGRVIRETHYRAMGGIAGALAAHADEAIGGLPSEAQSLVRGIFLRLITPERTRALVDLADLGDSHGVIDRLVEARLLVVQAAGDAAGRTVELVHESLISAWPRLGRWLDESREDAAFVAQLRGAAKQWEARGRPPGLLWRAEAAAEAQRWRGRDTTELAPRERDFLRAVLSLATRAARVRRAIVAGVIVFLAALAVAAVSALLVIRDAERAATAGADRATREAERARAAEERSRLDAEEARTQKQVADDRLRDLTSKDKQVARGKEDLREALGAAQTARDRAEAESARAREAESEWKKLYEEKKEQLEKLRSLNRRFD